jgi:hypothetical protein
MCMGVAGAMIEAGAHAPLPANNYIEIDSTMLLKPGI